MICQSVVISSSGHVSFVFSVKGIREDILFRDGVTYACESTYMFYTLETLNYSRHGVAAADEALF